jgi:chromosome partitioning protein
MAHKISFMHFKGGTGKTTSCLNVAGFLAAHGAKVLAVDLDPQSNLTSNLGIEPKSLRNSMAHVMSNNKDMKDIIMKTNVENLDIAPATPYLIHTSMNKYKHKDDATILKRALSSVDDYYHYILIDTPPSNGHFIVNGVVGSDDVVLVLDPSVYSMQSINNLNTIFKSYCKKLGFNFEISMALLTKHKGPLLPFFNTPSSEVHKSAEEALGKKVFTIPYSDHVYSSQKAKLPLSHHKPWSDVGVAYMKVAEELINMKKE